MCVSKVRVSDPNRTCVHKESENEEAVFALKEYGGLYSLPLTNARAASVASKINLYNTRLFLLL